MHIVILSQARAGSHMLRSMLKADARIRDIGAFLQPMESLVETPPIRDAADLAAFYEREARPGRIVLSNLKAWTGTLWHIPAAAETGGRFIHLVRRDRLAQAASMALALRHNCFYRPAPEGATVTLDPAHTAELLRRLEIQTGRLRAAILTFPHVELVYEDLTPETVAAAMRDLTGMDLAVGPPTTPKIAPPLETYVTNLSELRP